MRRTVGTLHVLQQLEETVEDDGLKAALNNVVASYRDGPQTASYWDKDDAPGNNELDPNADIDVIQAVVAKMQAIPHWDTDAFGDP